VPALRIKTAPPQNIVIGHRLTDEQADAVYEADELIGDIFTVEGATVIRLRARCKPHTVEAIAARIHAVLAAEQSMLPEPEPVSVATTTSMRTIATGAFVRAAAHRRHHRR
jgi:hypothetical protein